MTEGKDLSRVTQQELDEALRDARIEQVYQSFVSSLYAQITDDENEDLAHLSNVEYVLFYLRALNEVGSMLLSSVDQEKS